MLKEIFRMQSDLEKTILCDLDIGIEEVTNKKVLALIIEGSELMNELETLKYWKKKKRLNYIRAREEVIDCLHFVVGVTINLGYDLEDVLKEINSEIKEMEINTKEVKTLGSFIEYSNEVFSKGSTSGEIYNFLFNLYCEICIMLLNLLKSKRDKEIDQSMIYCLSKLLSIVLCFCKNLDMDEKDVYLGYVGKNIVNNKRKKGGY